MPSRTRKLLFGREIKLPLQQLGDAEISLEMEGQSVPACVPVMVFDYSDDCWTTVDSGHYAAQGALAISPNSGDAQIVGPWAVIANAGTRSRSLATSPYDPECHTYPCSRGVTFSFDWSFAHHTNRTVADLSDTVTWGGHILELSVGGSQISNGSPALSVSGSLYRASDGTLVAGTGKGWTSETGIAKNAVINQSGTNRPSYSASGSGASISWSAAEMAAAVVEAGGPVYLVLSTAYQYLVSVSPGAGIPDMLGFAAAATIDASLTNMELSFA